MFRVNKTAKFKKDVDKRFVNEKIKEFAKENKGKVLLIEEIKGGYMKLKGFDTWVPASVLEVGKNIKGLV